MQEIKTILCSIMLFLSLTFTYSQNKINKLFESQETLALKLSFSNKKVKKNQ